MGLIMPALETRLAKLEQQLPDANSPLEILLRALPPLTPDGRFDWEAVPGAYETLQKLSALRPRARKYARLLDPVEWWIADFLTASLREVERFHGRVSEAILAELYRPQINYGLPPARLLRIRQLARVVDKKGVPMPGYELEPDGRLYEVDTRIISREAAHA